TGWTGGGYGVGTRMKLAHTRAMVRAALSGQLDQVACAADPIFQLAVPAAVPDVPSEVLNPRNTWKDPAAYEKAARELAGLFRKNFERFAGAGAEIVAAGPQG
ncbi:MAG: phosphoenolpyruvate carboxykinase (ATP), partial [Terriglobales bacterium]